MTTPLETFRALVHRGIEQALQLDGVHKHYEGHITLQVDVPGYFAEHRTALWTLQLDCYVLGPGRHYYWHGTSEAEVLRVATRDVQGWIEELHDD